MRKLPAITETTSLLPWLLHALADSNRTHVKKLLHSGTVHVNGTSTTRHDHPLAPGDVVTLERVQPRALPIAFEDDALVIVDKPAGLLSVATDTHGDREHTAFRRVEAQCGLRPGVVHRLDRDTSGLLIFAKSRAVQNTLQAQWPRVEKTYLAIVEGLPPMEGTIDAPIMETKSLKCRIARHGEPGQSALTTFRVLQTNGTGSLLELRIHTGRKHQIRVHLASRGHAICGDPLYGARTNPAGRLCLHAHALRLPHPVTRVMIEVQSPLPPALANIVKAWTRTPSSLGPGRRG
jgi:23S rRNA pseudouridine1911/1915/1917 synthase